MMSVMCGYLLAGCLLFALPPQTSEVKLIAAIVDLGNENQAVKLSLINTTSLPITVISGVRTDHPYPTANFTFVLDLPHHSFKVNCANCGPEMIGGELGLYIVVIRPNSRVDLPDIKLSSLSYVEGVDHRSVCDAHTQQGRLRITLDGSAVSRHASSANEKYWTGTTSTSMKLSCKSS